jgi:hypothetical protein
MSDFNIEWRIYTSEEQKEKIVNRKSLVEHLTHKLGINTTILKSEAFDPREFLHETFIDCVKNGMEKNSIILFAPPDHIFGSGLRELVVESQVDSYIVCPHPRISYENAYESGEYKKLIYKNGLNSSAGYISNTELTTSAINKYAHQIVQYGINPDAIDGIKETSYWWNAKKSEDNLLVKFKEPPPVLLYARGDIIAGMLSDGYSSTFERVDHDLVEWMHKTHRLNVLRSNKNFFWVEYCKNGRNIPTLMNGYWPKSAQLIYDMPHIWKI